MYMSIQQQQDCELHQQYLLTRESMHEWFSNNQNIVDHYLESVSDLTPTQFYLTENGLPLDSIIKD